MKWKSNILVAVSLMVLAACSGGHDDGPSHRGNQQGGQQQGGQGGQQGDPSGDYVVFSPTLQPFNNSETNFDAPFQSGDEISVFAITSNQNGKLNNQGNYADNVRYTYNGSRFEPASVGISLPSQQQSLSYYAVYPYSTQARNEMTFSVQTNQSTLKGYNASDLRTAYTVDANASIANLQFYHSLCQVCATIESEKGIRNQQVQMTLQVPFQANVNVEADTYPATGNAATISMYYDSKTNRHFAIVPPQKLGKSERFLTIAYNGMLYDVEFYDDVVFQSNTQHQLTISFDPDEQGNLRAVGFVGQINPWEGAGTRAVSASAHP